MKFKQSNLSLPAQIRVRGYEIKRMPIGRFLAALQLLQDIPDVLMQAIFPDGDMEKALAQLKQLNGIEMLKTLFLRVIVALPEQVLPIVAQLLDVPTEDILDDPAIGLDGIAEMIGAWAEVNGIENFMKAANALKAKFRVQAATIGSSN
ncbi:MAG: hypothetical protein RSA59_05910 [Raoultibacter sp.]